MLTGGAAKLLRAYLSSADSWQGRGLAEAIVLRANAEGLAGATLIHGLEGYGANSRIHRADTPDLSTDLPVLVEIVDSPERVREFLPILDEMVTEGLLVLEDCEIVR